MQKQIQRPLKQVIGKDMTIAEILTVFPEKTLDISEVMREFGIHCAGCGAASFETLEQGVLGHGFSTADLDKLVINLNELVGSPTIQKKTNAEFKLTSSAIAKLKQVIKESKKENLRVSVLRGGCSGHTYNLELLKSTPQTDVKKSQGGIRISIDQKSVEFLDGVTLDYVDTLNESGFKFKNPNIKKECGCGKSFS